MTLLSPGWTPAVRAALERLVPGPRGRVAAFDFDGTCVHGDVSEAALALLDRDTGQGRVAAYEAACAVDVRTAYVELVGTLCGGRTEAEVQVLARRTFAERLVRVRAALRELAAALDGHGWEVWIVTASAAPIVQAVASDLGVAPERVLGMRPALGADGRYTATVVGPVTWKEGKVEALEHAGRGRPDLAIGDSEGDAAMLERATTAVWLDRGEPRLAARAAAQGWLVQPAAGLP